MWKGRAGKWRHSNLTFAINDASSAHAGSSRIRFARAGTGEASRKHTDWDGSANGSIRRFRLPRDQRRARGYFHRNSVLDDACSVWRSVRAWPLPRNRETRVRRPRPSSFLGSTVSERDRLVPLHCDFDRLNQRSKSPRQLFGSTSSSMLRGVLCCRRMKPALEGQHHLVNRGRADTEVLLHVGFGRRPAAGSADACTGG